MAGLVSAGPVAATLSPAFGQATTAHSLLLAWMMANDSGATDPWGSVSPGWTKVVSGGGAYEWTSLWYKADCGAGETAPTFTDAGGASLQSSMLMEFDGMLTSGVIDSSGAGVDDSTETATCAASDTEDGDLIIACEIWNGGAGIQTISQTMTDSGGAAVSYSVIAGPGPDAWHYNIVYGFAGAAGAGKSTATGTLSTFANGGCLIATFKAAPSFVVDTADPMAGGTQGSAYSQDLAASGGTEPYLWTLDSGSLPDGLVLS
jgi:hypothetical protein